jgi:adenosylmethionine-8-amino-7-oxononanoate aminotransferase
MESSGMNTVEEDKRYLWHPFTRMSEWLDGKPLVIERAGGVYLYDENGVRYLDAVASLWANVHGHRHPAIDEAVRGQLARVAHTTLLGLTSAPAVELARRIVELAPTGLSRVFYSGDGASAVEAALKISYQYWRSKGGRFVDKRRFMSFTNGYHGDTLGAVGVGGIELFHSAYRDLLSPSIRLPYAHCYRCHLGLSYPSCGLACARKLEPYFRDHAGETAAVIVEPKVQGAAGMIVAPDGFMRSLRELCTRYGVHLIADEVATGFGRTGTLFACEHDRVSPDLMCLGKGITGGYMALSATLATEEIFEGFSDGSGAGTFFHGHTYSGNPLACAAGLASLDVFRREGVLAKLPEKVRRLETDLGALRELPAVGDVRQAGLMAGVELVSDKAAKTPFAATARMGARVTEAMRSRGVISRPLGDVLTLVLPLAVSSEDVDLAVGAMHDSILEITRES